MKKWRIARFFCAFMVLAMLLVPAGTATHPASINTYAKTTQKKAAIKLSTKVKKVDKNGNLVLSATRKELYKTGFSKKDIVKIRIGKRDYDYIMPLYSGSMIWGKTFLDVKKNEIKITRQDRSFAKREHLEGVTGKKVTVTMYKKNGYQMGSVTSDIADYGSDARVFTNFRMVSAGGIGENKLFRSCSPATVSKPYYGRLPYINELVRENGIASIISLNLDEEKISSKVDAGVCTQYMELYGKGNVSAIGLNGKYIDSKEFRQGLASHLKFMANHNPPFLVHCAIGRDRTGFTIALLEALMGASYDELAEDYVITYRNYNHVAKNTAVDTYLKTSIDDTIQGWLVNETGYRNPKKVNLVKAAKTYMKKVLGLSDSEVGRIQEVLK